MKKYILLKTSKENFSYLMDVLKMLIGNNIHWMEYETYMSFEYQDASDLEILSTIQSLESDLNTEISMYQTSTNQPEKEIGLILPTFLEASYGHYQFKSLLLKIKNKSVALEIFSFITEGTGINEQIILAMADCDMNVSQASTNLFMHRNTLLYKIERLLEKANFDLKRFNDLYILVHLLKA